MLPQVASGKAYGIKVFRCLAVEMRIAVRKHMATMLQHDDTAPAGGIGGQSCVPAGNIPVLSDLPFLGEAFFQHTAFTYLAFLAVPFVLWLMNRTPFGLAVKVAGENPMALEAQGIDVLGVRTLAVIIGSALMALGGAYLTMSAFDAFYFGMVNGRGWIAVALVIFASWRPSKALLGALLFAGLDAYQVRAQQLAGAVVPYQFFLMLPYLLSIVAMVVAAKSTRYPKALLTPFRRGERH